MATEIVGISSILNIVDAIIQDNITIGNSPNWVIQEGMWIFRGLLGSLYECIFTRLGMHPPFFDFEMVVINHLKVSPLHLHLGAWAPGISHGNLH